MKKVLSFFAMCKAILQRRYPMPWKTFFLALFCLIYFISPLDIIPDVFPVLGEMDDATFLLCVLAVIGREVDKYRSSLLDDKNNVVDLGNVNDFKK